MPLTPGAPDKELDCAWRELALSMATQKLGPAVGGGVHAALQLQRLCGSAPPSGRSAGAGLPSAQPRQEVAAQSSPHDVFVDSERGLRDSRADGSRAAPYATLLQARDAVRALPASLRSERPVRVLPEDTKLKQKLNRK